MMKQTQDAGVVAVEVEVEAGAAPVVDAAAAIYGALRSQIAKPQARAIVLNIWINAYPTRTEHKTAAGETERFEGLQ